MQFSAQEVCDHVRGRMVNTGSLKDEVGQVRVSGVSALQTSQKEDIAFFFSKNYQQHLPGALPGILITGEPFVAALEASGLPLWESSLVIAAPDPYWAMGKVSEMVAPFHSAVGPAVKRSEQSIHPTAVVDASAEIGPGVLLGAHVVVEAGVVIGAHSQIYAGSYLGPGVHLGEFCQIFPHVVVYEHVQIGDRVRIHAGSVIGGDGFGYAPVVDSGEVTGHQKIYHLGRVLIGDDVEIGANATVDRGTIEDTVIESQVKLDDDVHIGHNARVYQGAVICGATALAGRASVGRYAYVGGLTGVTNDVHIGDGAKVGAVSLVTHDVSPGDTAVGNPQRTHKEHFRAHAWLNKQSIRKKKD